MLSTLTANSAASRVALAIQMLTVARLAVVPGVIMTLMTDSHSLVFWLGGFMVADLFDGVTARRLAIDDARRRAVDATVDRVAINACLCAAFLHGMLPLALLTGFLARDVYCAVLSLRLLRVHKIVIKVDLRYRALGLAVGLWGLALPFIGDTSRIVLATTLAVAGAALAVDLTRCAAVVTEDSRRVRGLRLVDVRTLRAAARLRTVGPRDHIQNSAKGVLT